MVKTSKETLHLINNLCKNHSIDSNQLEQFLLKSSLTFEELICFKHKQTGDNVLHFATRAGNLNLLKLIKDKVANDAEFYFTNLNNDGKNVLHEACQYEHLECAKFLIEVIGISVNKLRKADWTCLMLACTKKNFEMVEYLVKNEADMEQMNKDGWNALHIAVREGHLNIVEFLLKKDLRKSIMNRSKNGRTVYHTAALHGHLDIFNLLINAQKTCDNTNVLEIFSLKDSCGVTPFMDALLADHVHIVKYIIEEYDYIEQIIMTRDIIENNCIHSAAQTGSLKSCIYLYDKYYNLKLKQLNEQRIIYIFQRDLNKYGMTPVHSACKNNRHEVLLFFLTRLRDEVGSNSIDLINLISQPDLNNRSAIDIATAAGYEQCISLLNNYLL